MFRINPGEDEHPLHIPFWALEPLDLFSFLMGRLDDRPLSQVLDRVLHQKTTRAENPPIPGADPRCITAISPIPFSLKQLWFELIDPEVKTWADQQRTTPAIIDPGNAEALRIPQYRPPGAGSSAPFINQQGVLGIRRQLDQMRSRLLDRQYDFLLHPGPWEPNLTGIVEKDIPDLLATWLGHEKAVTILDLSGIPSVVLIQLIGAILNVVYEGLFWGRAKSEGGINRPMLIVMEEAHRYLAKGTDNPARNMVQRIVKEGRKFGIGAMIISQRPSEVDETILSQCATFIALRLSNAADRSKVQAALPDSLAGVIDSLPVLRTGEAIITGEAARLPIRCRITLPAEENRPNSEAPEVAEHWQRQRIHESYDRVAASWRSQNPCWVVLRPARVQLPKEEVEQMERETVSSSTILSIGYDQASETLEVEFKNAIYQYYNVPSVVHQQFMESSSKGQFLHFNIKNAYPYSRV